MSSTSYYSAPLLLKSPEAAAEESRGRERSGGTVTGGSRKARAFLVAFLAHRTFLCELLALGFVCLFVFLYGDLAITAAYYCHLANPRGASDAASPRGASGAAALAVLASASASAHCTSPSW